MEENSPALSAVNGGGTAGGFPPSCSSLYGGDTSFHGDSTSSSHVDYDDVKCDDLGGYWHVFFNHGLCR